MPRARPLQGWFAALSRRGFSIRSRIVLLVVIAVGPLLYDRVRLLEATRQEQIGAASAQAIDLARIAVDKQEEMLISARSVLQTITHTLDHIAVPGADCNRVLAGTASDVAWLMSMTVISTDGFIVCASNQKALGLDVGDRPYFRQALETGGFAVSDLIQPRSNSKPGIVVALGKRDADGVVRHVVGALVDLRWIGQLGQALQRPGAVALLLDAGGTVISGYPDDDGWAGRDLSGYALTALAGQRKEGSTTSADFDRHRRIWGFLPVEQAGNVVLVGLDERAVLTRLDREMTFAYVQLGLIVLLVLLGAWVFGERTILGPIRALARTAERIGRGDLAVRIGRGGWASEFVPLARSLDSMAARLEARDKSLRIETDHFRELATVDALTGLANRRAFDARLSAAWQLAAARQTPVALLMIDVDRFKPFNDRYGHLEGDSCLRTIGALLADSAPEGTHAARYGGEEFAVLMPQADSQVACALAERIRTGIAALGVTHADAPTGVVTVSIGVAALIPDRAERYEALIDAADAALYVSKYSRNTMSLYAPPALALAEAS
jgi:diguanylate cyclase (GGDEF)-like protein